MTLDDLFSDQPRDRRLYGLLIVRLTVGWIFLHSGIGKLVEDGLAYGYASTYLQEATPLATPDIALGLPGLLELPVAILVTAGATVMEPVFHLLAGCPFIGPLVVICETVIGLGLILGAFTRVLGLLGAFMMLLFYYGNAEWSHGLINGDMVYLILFLIAALAGTGRVLGLDERLRQTSLVQDHPRLRYLLG